MADITKETITNAELAAEEKDETGLKKVLEVLYGGLTEGYVAVTYMEGEKNKKKCTTKFFPVEEREEIRSYIEENGKIHHTHMGINPRAKRMFSFQRGCREDICAVICAYQDFDLKCGAHKEERLPENVEDLQNFLNTLPIKPSFLVSSGNGIHAYWVFDTPFKINNEEERCYIENLLKGWENYIHNLAFEKHGWAFDCVADLPRMFRAVGSRNFKTEELPVCRLLTMTDDRCTPKDLEKYCEETPKVSEPIPWEHCSADNHESEELRKQCSFINHCWENAATLSEPYWYGAISNIAHAADGHDAVHSMSKPYQGYTYKETEGQYKNALKANKPQTCEYIKNKLKFDCGKSCGVKAPIALLHKKKEPSNWEEPIPLNEVKLPLFPIETLPKEISDYVLAVAESTQTPVDLPSVVAIAVMSICLQKKYTIFAKEDWSEGLNTFSLIIMPPSERKSPVCKAMAKPINEYEQDWNKEHEMDISMSKIQKSILENKLKKVQEDAAKDKANFSQVKDALKNLKDFKETQPMKLYNDDITLEKLVSTMANNNERAAIFSTEAGIFELLKGIYTRNVNIDPMLKAYSNDFIRVDRVGRESEIINQPALTVMLMGQPNVLSGVMENPNFTGRGLTARFLYSMPMSRVGSRTFESESVSQEVYEAYNRCIRKLLENEATDTPRSIILSSEARALISAFSAELEPKLISEYEAISEWAGKLVGNIVRIAGLLCATEELQRDKNASNAVNNMEVNGKTMENAIKIGRYFLEHAKAAFSLLGADENKKKCIYLLRIIKEKNLKSLSKREVMRECRSFKTADEAQSIIDLLVDYGYLAEKEEQSYNGKGRSAGTSYLVNPYVHGGD